VAFDWTCPHCHRHQVVTDANMSIHRSIFDLGKSRLGENLGIDARAFRCTSNACNDVTLHVFLGNLKYSPSHSGYIIDKLVDEWQLRPDGAAKIQPDFIPLALREDYQEACGIKERSPKAAATLARRCLQGMIRDFCKLSRGTLAHEIEALRELLDQGKAPAGVTTESIDAIDHVRQVGNIGAHMEKDINIIVDVEEGEAQTLIELIEMLFDEWYVARNTRQERLNRVAEIAAEKKLALISARNDQQQSPPENAT